MYVITLTHIATGEDMQSYTNPLPMSAASIDYLERRYGIAVTQVQECEEHIVLETREVA